MVFSNFQLFFVDLWRCLFCMLYLSTSILGQYHHSFFVHSFMRIYGYHNVVICLRFVVLVVSTPGWQAVLFCDARTGADCVLLRFVCGWPGDCSFHHVGVRFGCRWTMDAAAFVQLDLGLVKCCADAAGVWWMQAWSLLFVCEMNKWVECLFGDT